MHPVKRRAPRRLVCSFLTPPLSKTGAMGQAEDGYGFPAFPAFLPPPGETSAVRHPPGADPSAGASERPPSRAAQGPFIAVQRRPLTEEGRGGARLLVGRGRIGCAGTQRPRLWSLLGRCLRSALLLPATETVAP